MSARPPAQTLRGAGFLLHFNPDTAPAWPCVKLRRRAQVISTAGVVRSPVRLVTYEVYTDGEVRRVDESGDAKVVPDGHAEWKWARAALAAIHEGRDTPLDLVRWKIAHGSRRGEWTGTPLASLKSEG